MPANLQLSRSAAVRRLSHLGDTVLTREQRRRIMHMRTRALIAAAATVVAMLIAPSRAFAITADQIVELTKGGVSEAVILAVIARDNTPFDLNADELVALKQQGVSDTIVMAMLKSG